MKVQKNRIIQPRTFVAPGVIIKQFLRLVRHPWIWTKLLSLQGEKWLFNLLYPYAGEGRAHRIRQLSIRITDVCNLRCHTCGQWGDNGYLLDEDIRELKRKEVSTRRYQELLEDLVQHGHRPLFYIWGGEPMLYGGTIDLIKTGTNLGLPSSLVSNGTGIADSARTLIEAPLFLLQVSIDGHNEETHNTARPAKGGGSNFNTIVTALKVINDMRSRKRQALPLIASLTVISQYNQHHLTKIYERFRNEVDMFVFYLSWWIDQTGVQNHTKEFFRRFGFKPKSPAGWVGNWRPDNYLLLQKQMLDLLRFSRGPSQPPVLFIPAVQGIHNLQAYYTSHSERFGFDQCVSIFQAVEINSNGDMSPCRDYHDYVVGNVKENTISSLWNSPAYNAFRKSIHSDGLMPVCSRCCGLMGY